ADRRRTCRRHLGSGHPGISHCGTPRLQRGPAVSTRRQLSHSVNDTTQFVSTRFSKGRFAMTVTQNRNSTTSTATVDLRQVSLVYPDGQNADGTQRTIAALDQVDFTANKGELAALVGQSGSGKSDRKSTRLK